MLLVPYIPELSELARGDLFFFFFLEHPSFLRVVVHHCLCWLILSYKVFCHLLTLIYSVPSLPTMVNHSFPTHCTKLLDAVLHIKSQACHLFMKMQISQQEKNHRSRLLVYIALCPHLFSLRKRLTYPEFLRELPVQYPQLKVIFQYMRT